MKKSSQFTLLEVISHTNGYLVVVVVVVVVVVTHVIRFLWQCSILSLGLVMRIRSLIWSLELKEPEGSDLVSCQEEMDGTQQAKNDQ